MAKTPYINTYEKLRQERLKKDPGRWRLSKKDIVISKFSQEIIPPVIDNILFDFNCGFAGRTGPWLTEKGSSKVRMAFDMYGPDNKSANGEITWDLSKNGDMTLFYSLDKYAEETVYYDEE